MGRLRRRYNFSKEDSLRSLLAFSDKNNVASKLEEKKYLEKISEEDKETLDAILETEGVKELTKEIIAKRINYITQILNSGDMDKKWKERAEREADFWSFVNDVLEDKVSESKKYDKSNLPDHMYLGDQIEPIKQRDPTGCNRACRSMIDNYNNTAAEKIGGADITHSLIKEKGTNSEKNTLDESTLVFSGINSTKSAVLYMLLCLANNRPVMVGVTRRTDKQGLNADNGVTDHFVLVTGYDQNKKLFTFNDPADGKKHTFTVAKINGQPALVSNDSWKKYVVSQVRPYTDKGFRFKDLTGSDIVKNYDPSMAV